MLESLRLDLLLSPHLPWILTDCDCDWGGVVEEFRAQRGRFSLDERRESKIFGSLSDFEGAVVDVMILNAGLKLYEFR